MSKSIILGSFVTGLLILTSIRQLFNNFSYFLNNYPLIIIAPGSGPTDHNGNTLPLNVTPCLYYYLAKNL